MRFFRILSFIVLMVALASQSHLIAMLTCSGTADNESLNQVPKIQKITIGIYSGTFDPPTLAHETIIRMTIKKFSLKTLYIFVNKNGSKNCKCSLLERVAMLRVMLSDLGEKIIIVPQASEKKYQDYLFLKNILNKPVIHITGQDSYEKKLLIESKIAPQNRVDFDAIAIIPRSNDVKNLKLEPNAFVLLVGTDLLSVSSTQVRDKLSIGDLSGLSINKAVLGLIIQRNLYKSSPEKEVDFEKAFYEYVGKNLIKCPLPPFDPLSSREAWDEYFQNLVFVKKQGSYAL